MLRTSDDIHVQDGSRTENSAQPAQPQLKTQAAVLKYNTVMEDYQWSAIFCIFPQQLDEY